MHPCPSKHHTLGPRVCHAHPEVPIGTWMGSAREVGGMKTQSHSCGSVPSGLGLWGHTAKSQASRAGNRLQEGPSCLVIPSPASMGQAVMGQQAPTRHTSRHCLGTIPKGQSGHSKLGDQKGGLSSVPAAGPQVPVRGLCTCHLESHTCWLPPQLLRQWGGSGASRACRWGTSEAASHSTPTLQPRGGSWGTSSHLGLPISPVAPS